MVSGLVKDLLQQVANCCMAGGGGGGEGLSCFTSQSCHGSDSWLFRAGSCFWFQLPWGVWEVTFDRSIGTIPQGEGRLHKWLLAFQSIGYVLWIWAFMDTQYSLHFTRFLYKPSPSLYNTPPPVQLLLESILGRFYCTYKAQVRPHFIDLLIISGMIMLSIW